MDTNDNQINKVKFNSYDNTCNTSNNNNYYYNSNDNRDNIKNNDNTITITNNNNINKNENNNSRTSKQLKINIICFIPLFSKNVATKIGRYFPNLIDKHFPCDHKFHKVFNRINIKVTYNCMQEH